VFGVQSSARRIVAGSMEASAEALGLGGGTGVVEAGALLGVGDGAGPPQAATSSTVVRMTERLRTFVGLQT
jgi:hypothetical protein